MTPLASQRVVQVADGMPSAPRVLAEVQALLKNANNDLDEVTALLRRDAGLTARVIRIANGVVYGAGERVASLEEALGRVGFDEVHRLTGLASLAQLVNFQCRFYPVPATRLRENSLFGALVMQELAPSARTDPRTAFTAGLMRSVGKILLDATAQKDLRWVRAPAITGGLLEWERSLFGLTNPDVAAVVLRGWRFPADVFVPIRDHYLHTLLVDPLPLAKALHVAAATTEAAGFGLPGESAYWAAGSGKACGELGLDVANLQTVAERVRPRFEQLRAALA